MLSIFYQFCHQLGGNYLALSHFQIHWFHRRKGFLEFLSAVSFYNSDTINSAILEKHPRTVIVIRLELSVITNSPMQHVCHTFGTTVLENVTWRKVRISAQYKSAKLQESTDE